ncbi:PCNA-associated factor isoform X1 [Phalacrocorax aristotelis]|uniref:PCNA-associated factor isoform X1 n=1 Tax=Phalacrocorax aristotelis TaxID=126867 RepID=UPI003F4B7B28
MVRTKVDCGGAFRKVLAARAPRKALGSRSINAGQSLAAKRGEGRRVGGNQVCVRPVPAWQRGIGEFLRLPQKENRAPGGEAAGSSGMGSVPKKFTTDMTGWLLCCSCAPALATL